MLPLILVCFNGGCDRIANYGRALVLLSDRTRQKAEQEFSLEVQTRRDESLYRELLLSSRSPGTNATFQAENLNYS